MTRVWAVAVLVLLPLGAWGQITLQPGPGFDLGPGEYQVDITIRGSTAEGPWAQPATVQGGVLTIAPPPAPPVAPTVVNLVEWWQLEVPAVPGATSYVPEWSIEEGPWVALPETEAPVARVPVPRVCYRMRAKGPGGLGAPSVGVCANP